MSTVTQKRGFAPLTKKHSFFRSNFCPEIVTFWLKFRHKIFCIHNLKLETINKYKFLNNIETITRYIKNTIFELRSNDIYSLNVFSEHWACLRTK